MYIDDIVDRIKVACGGEDVKYSVIVESLCRPIVFKVLPDVIATLIRNNVPEEHVEEVYFYHMGDHPLDVPDIFPEMAMYTFAGESVYKIFSSIRYSTYDHNRILKDIFTRYWFGNTAFKSSSCFPAPLTNFEPYSEYELRQYYSYIKNNCDFSLMTNTLIIGAISPTAYIDCLNECFIEVMDDDATNDCIETITMNAIISDDDLTFCIQSLSRLCNKHKLLYGGNK